MMLIKQRIVLGLAIGSFLLTVLTTAYADISGEENEKKFLGEKLKAIQTGTRTEVENLHDKAIKYNLYNEGADTTELKDLIIRTHLTPANQFCGANAEQRFNCLTQNMLRQFADLKVTSLTSGTRYDNERKIWAQYFLNNLITPELMSQFTQENMNPEKMSDADFTRAYGKALANQAAITVGQQPFIDIMARRTPTGGSTMMEVMEEAASARFLNEDWKTKMVGIKVGNVQVKPPLKPEVVLIDVAQMLSFQIWLQYQQYLQMENMQALLGALLIQNVRGAQAGQALLEKGSNVQVPK